MKCLPSPIHQQQTSPSFPSSFPTLKRKILAMVLQYGRVSGGLLIRLSRGSTSQLSFQGLSGYSAEYFDKEGGKEGRKEKRSREG